MTISTTSKKKKKTIVLAQGDSAVVGGAGKHRPTSPSGSRDLLPRLAVFILYLLEFIPG